MAEHDLCGLEAELLADGRGGGMAEAGGPPGRDAGLAAGPIDRVDVGRAVVPLAGCSMWRWLPRPGPLARGHRCLAAGALLGAVALDPLAGREQRRVGVRLEPL